MELNLAIELINHKSIDRIAKQVWADVGSGSGLFTQALASLIAPDSKIYAIDKNPDALKKLQQPVNVTIEKMQADFVRDEMNLSNLDGILMANSLHFVRDKVAFINKIDKYLKPDGFFLIVEYDMDTPNTWVPFPVSYLSLQKLFEKPGYAPVEKINELPSRYNRANIYSAWVIPKARD